MEIITIYTENKEQLKAFKVLAKVLKIKSTQVDGNKSPYDSAFVAKIKAGDEDMKKGNGKKMSMEELDNLWK